MSRSLNSWVTIIRQGRQACDIISSVMGPFPCLGNVGLMLLEIPVIQTALLIFYSVFMFKSKNTRMSRDTILRGITGIGYLEARNY